MDYREPEQIAKLITEDAGDIPKGDWETLPIPEAFEDQVKLVHEGNNLVVYELLTVEAVMLASQGTKWGLDNQYYAIHYLPKRLIIFYLGGKRWALLNLGATGNFQKRVLARQEKEKKEKEGNMLKQTFGEPMGISTAGDEWASGVARSPLASVKDVNIPLDLRQEDFLYGLIQRIS
jgi:hypothetical protein